MNYLQIIKEGLIDCYNWYIYNLPLIFMYSAILTFIEKSPIGLILPPNHSFWGFIIYVLLVIVTSFYFVNKVNYIQLKYLNEKYGKKNV